MEMARVEVNVSTILLVSLCFMGETYLVPTRGTIPFSISLIRLFRISL